MASQWKAPRSATRPCSEHLLPHTQNYWKTKENYGFPGGAAMLPEGGPAQHFGGRFSETVTQKSFKTIGKTNTFEESRYPANLSAPSGPQVRFAGPGPPQSAHAQKPLGKQRKTNVSPEAPLCCLRGAQRIILGVGSRSALPKNATVMETHRQYRRDLVPLQQSVVPWLDPRRRR